ncbi:fructose-specific PTS transporter subunit EIIC [Anaerovorax odorimutans]|uniref:Fructose-specific PTS transporter subunit EIIC n=1 Tax=Anaerovorax odorimutans TaxID=109327 RepID=A0ABT1RSU6_9FIRM|nr:fructose-specific PTS transporter subunit EIIC [Anaerovorax odorimutans]MCQ4638258.1 fructose-specific PTS transporter subunit EIIC [Anaerovorax odorimutans]
MRIIDLLQKGSIVPTAQVNSKAEAIDLLVDLHEQAGNLADKRAYKEGILAREEEGTTAVGEGIAIPHAKSEAVKKAGLAAITVPEGIDYQAPDGKPSCILFMIAAPMDGDLHLEVLSRLMTLLMDMELRAELLKAQTAEEFLSALDARERERYSEEGAQREETAVSEKESTEAREGGYRILAVTACPTGIAHTYMAAEALEKKAGEMGYTLKAETNGSGGAKNVLTPEEIQAADGIIVAADKNVDMARFDGKRVYKTNVSAGINHPEELIEKIIKGEAPIFHREGDEPAEAETVGRESAGRQIYRHLMNGVSYMLPFVIGGGIMIALAFLIDTIAGAPRDSDFGAYTAAAAFFKTIGGIAFGFMMPVLAGYIARSIADRPGLAVGFVGGSIATLGCTFANVAGDPAAVSGFLGALIAGFAGGYIVLLLKKLFSFLPSSLESMLPVLILPLFGIILMGAFMCFINPAVGAINTAITNGLNSMGSTSQILLGCILAGMMAIDMGGPFNKAAYVFGTAAIASGGFNVMAAVMIGGMVPPIAIALATTFFKHKFTAEERKAGLVNYIMGLCFITEGAIPFAASDPLRVIPSCVAGSAVAGGISMAMGCTLRAPHGGIFVFPVVGSVGGYLLALVIGSLVGMILLAILKKTKTAA